VFEPWIYWQASAERQRCLQFPLVLVVVNAQAPLAGFAVRRAETQVALACLGVVADRTSGSVGTLL
jgi:hypothetical protein